MEHIQLLCERFMVIRAVQGRINLSSEESLGLLDLSVEGSITCNCARRRGHGEPRDLKTLERLTTDAVLQARARINHPGSGLGNGKHGKMEFGTAIHSAV